MSVGWLITKRGASSADAAPRRIITWGLLKDSPFFLGDSAMAQISNIHNLPEEVYRALCKNRYSGDAEDSGVHTDFSATTLLAPTQQTILKKRYPDCNEDDCIDRFWSMFGQIAHALLEEHGSDDALTEKRFYITVLGKIISGAIDNIKKAIISDYKTTSVYKIQKKSYEDWERQLNIYAFLCRMQTPPLPVRSLRIIAIIRDWQASKADIPAYPSAPIVEIPLTLWTIEEQTAYVEKRVQALIDAEALPDNLLPECTREERWQGANVWAVLKDGVKRAVRLYATREEAEERAKRPVKKTNTSVYTTEERQGIPRRCMQYCAASKMCRQQQQYLIQQSSN
jgi:hypothetical protein